MKTPLALLLIFASICALGQTLPPAQEPYSVKADKLGESQAKWTANNPGANCGTYRADDLNEPIADQPAKVVCHPAQPVRPSCISTGNASRGWGPETVTCSTGDDLTYAGVSIEQWEVHFYRDQLFQVNLTVFGSGRFDSILQSLAEAYGTPALHPMGTVRNGLGIETQITEYRWKRSGSTITTSTPLSVEGDFITTFSFRLDAPYAEVMALRNAAKQGKAHSDM
jgi:hypothetical protein